MVEDSLKRITNYIFDSRFVRALLIDGDWGCGKSYFVKNTLIDAIDKTIIPKKNVSANYKKNQNKKVDIPKHYSSVLVSLYGVTEVESIQNAIYAAFLEKFTDNLNDKRVGFVLKNLALFGITTVKGTASFFNVGEQTESLFSQVGDGILTLQKENIVLIFDDIERCQVDIIELMGFLNNLCENNGYRVILIANEKEIARQENDIVKAINAQTALIDIYENQHTLQNDKKFSNRKINKDCLDLRRESLFERNTLYERTREKLIGLTIRFTSRLEDVYDAILEKTISDDKTKELLKNRKSFIITIFEEHNHENLRTLISIFIAIEAVIDVFEASPDLSEGDRKAIDVERVLLTEVNLLLEYIIYAAINRVNGITPEKLAEGTRYGYINNGLFSKEKMHLRYAFVDEYWDTLVADLNVAKTDFNNRINESISYTLNRVHDKEHYDLALFRLKEWYCFSDEEVLTDIKRMKQELKEKKYYPYDFKDIIYTLMCINNPNFGMEFDKEAESSDNHIYDATDENTFHNNINADEQRNDDEVISATKIEYNKWRGENINEYVELMLKYTEDEGLELDSEMLRLLSENYDLAKRYRSYIQPLLDWINKKELAKLEKTDEGCDALDIDSEELYKFFSDRRDSYITKRHFLSLYGYEDIEKFINDASVKRLFDFAEALSAVYNFGNLRDFFSDDYYTVNKVWFDLKSDRENDRNVFNKDKSRTREIALRRLENCFEKYRNLLRDPHEIIEDKIKTETE